MASISKIQSLTPPAVIWQKTAEFSNEQALSLLGKELEGGMPKEKVSSYLDVVKKICANLSIQIKDLPINSEHKGNLSADKMQSVFEEVVNSVVFNKVV